MGNPDLVVPVRAGFTTFLTVSGGGEKDSIDSDHPPPMDPVRHGKDDTTSSLCQTDLAYLGKSQRFAECDGAPCLEEWSLPAQKATAISFFRANTRMFWRSSALRAFEAVA
jgi:hypothetical protein